MVKINEQGYLSRTRRGAQGGTRRGSDSSIWFLPISLNLKIPKEWQGKRVSIKFEGVTE